MLVPKILLIPIKHWIFGPKTAEIGPKYAFLVILGQTLHFVMWVTKLLISPIKIRILCPKIAEFCIFVHCRLIWCPVGGLAGGCGARAVSRKTPFYFIEGNIEQKRVFHTLPGLECFV